VLDELGVGITAYGVLSRGLLTGSRPSGAGDLRGHLPRFSGGNLEQNQQVVGTLRSMAAERGCTPSQLAIAWVLAKRPNIVPVIGAKTRTQLKDSLGALDIDLSAADIAQIETAVPPSAVAGTRYGEQQMRLLDSERQPEAR